MWCNSKAALLVSLLFLSGCRNLYQDLSFKTSTEYLYYEAQKDVDSMRFSAAITKLDVVMAREPNNYNAAYLYSIARSGRAGLRVIKIFETLSQSMGSLFDVLATSFDPLSDSELYDFEIAVSSLETFWPTPLNRSADQNFYALFLYLGRIGAVLNRYAYDSNGDLLITNFSACHTDSNKSAAKTGIPNAQLDVVMTMIPRVIDTVDRLAEMGAGDFLDTSALQALGTFSYDPIPCSAAPGGIPCRAVRTIINNGSTGIGLGTGQGAEAIACAIVTP